MRLKTSPFHRGSMKLRLKKVSFVIIVIIIFFLLIGPLHPWSPVILGFKAIETDKTKIYLSQNLTLDQLRLSATQIDDIAQSIEETHHLFFKEKVKIFLCNGWMDEFRYFPWIQNGGKAVSLFTGDVIFIFPFKVARPDQIARYIGHELSHSLVFQTARNFADAYELGSLRWFIEGLAVYYGGPEYYDPIEWKSKFIASRLIFEKGNLRLFKEWEKNDPGFRYDTYGHFMKFLEKEMGSSKFFSFIHKTILNPQDYITNFQYAFQMELKEAVAQFQNNANNKSF